MAATKVFYNGTIAAGTTVTMGGGRGFVLSASDKHSHKEELIFDGAGALASVVEFDPKVESTVEILLDPAGSVPEVGTSVTLGGGLNANIILTEVTQMWETMKGKKLRLIGKKHTRT